MKGPMTFLLLSTVLFGCSPTGDTSGPTVSGVTEYSFEPEPQEISPKMYNWEVKLSEADCRNAECSIVQVTTALENGQTGGDTTTNILVDPEMIVPNRDGEVHFKLHVGDKEPVMDMNAAGHIGHPLSFSGIGTGKGASGWVVLPGSAVQEVTPSEKGAGLLEGELCLIRFIVASAEGGTFRSEVVLRLE